MGDGFIVDHSSLLPARAGRKKAHTLTQRVPDDIMALVREVRRQGRTLQIDTAKSLETTIHEWALAMLEAMRARLGERAA